MVNYPVGDFLIQIKNAALARRRKVVLKSTKLIKAVALVLKKEGFLEDVSVRKGILTATLAYRRKELVLLNLKLASKPGLRIYMSADDLAQKKGSSVLILSTAKGVISSHTAVKQRVGGEVIVEVW